MNPVEPHSWIGLVGVLATVAATVVVAVLGARGQRGLNAVRAQVENDHSTNLRDDLDQLRTVIDAGMRDIRRDIGGLREELRQERHDRAAADDRLEALHHR